MGCVAIVAPILLDTALLSDSTRRPGSRRRREERGRIGGDGSARTNRQGTDRQMSQSAKAQEPSMEEILASIRRIIADDDPAKPAAKPAAAAPAPPPPAPAAPPRAAAPPPPPPTPAPPPPAAMSQSEIDAVMEGQETRPSAQDDILELTEAMAEPAAGAGDFQTIDGQPDVVFADAPPSPEPHRFAEEPRAAPPSPPQIDRTLISSSTTAAVDSAFNSLAHTVLVQNARTLEDLVREMLRPMLKAWLDDNLPGMVERIVRAEIERVSRGRG
jgi:cell pole-organizing protein PopZ